MHDSYNGDVVTYSDDGGASYRFSGELHKPGLDECALAQLHNGSVLAISRSCNVTGGFSSANCETIKNDFSDARGSSAGAGFHHFAYSISNDGGAHWSPLGRLAQTLTPVCQASMTSYKRSVYYSSPFNADTRRNLTILAADDGVNFNRSLLLDPGPAGYSSVVCGFPGREDCGVMYDGQNIANASKGCRGGKCWVQFIRFASADVK